MSLSNYDIVYACSELFSIYIIYYDRLSSQVQHNQRKKF